MIGIHHEPIVPNSLLLHHLLYQYPLHLLCQVLQHLRSPPYHFILMSSAPSSLSVSSSSPSPASVALHLTSSAPSSLSVSSSSPSPASVPLHPYFFCTIFSISIFFISFARSSSFSALLRTTSSSFLLHHLLYQYPLHLLCQVLQLLRPPP